MSWIYAAISLFPSNFIGRNLEVALGTPFKHAANPLFEQDQPWETRIDNGYPNVLRTDDGTFHLWYGTCTSDCNRQFLLYANSTDGLSWTKPELGLFNFSTAGIEGFEGTDNNVLVEAGGVGVFLDPSETDPARRFKAIGPGCWSEATLAQVSDMANCLEGDVVDGLGVHRFWGQIAVSADGLTWPSEGVLNVSWPPPQKWDTHTNAFFDERHGDFVITTRSIPLVDGAPQRTVSVTRSAKWDLGYDANDVLPIQLNGTVEHQPYAQITFPWHNILLGLVMVFDDGSEDGFVHCRLSWSDSEGAEWAWLGGDDVLSAPDFINLGEMGGEDEGNAFDSHIIFAAKPIKHPETGEELLYYMGGNGPHDQIRDSSFGLATLRPDGFACVRGTGTFTTVELVVTGKTLTATVDFPEDGGSNALRVAVLPAGADAPPDSLSLARSVPLTENATDAPLLFEGGVDLSDYIDTTVRLVVSLEGSGGAMLFTLGFASS